MTKYNHYKVLIIICWLLLGLCCIIKLFGSDLFIASTDNRNFISFCNYVESTAWYILLGSVVNFISCGIYYMAVLKENKITKNSLKWIIPLLPYVVLKQIFYTNNEIKLKDARV